MMNCIYIAVAGKYMHFLLWNETALLNIVINDWKRQLQRNFPGRIQFHVSYLLKDYETWDMIMKLTLFELSLWNFCLWKQDMKYSCSNKNTF